MKVPTERHFDVCVRMCVGCFEAVFDVEDLQEGTEFSLVRSLTLSRSVKWTSKSQSETRKLKENGMGTD